MTAPKTHRLIHQSTAALLFVFILSTITLCLVFSETASQAAWNGIRLCGTRLIPSLFPCLVLSKLLIKLGFATTLGRYCGRPFARLFGVSPATVTAFLCGCLGGFPTGAATVFQLRREGYLNERDTLRALILSSSASPAFLIGTVGHGLLGHPVRGIFLYIAQVVALLIVGVILQFVHPRRPSAEPFTSHRALPSFPGALAGALKEGTEALLSVCGTVIFFSALGGLFLLLPLFSEPLRALILSALELTSGIARIQNLMVADQALPAIAAAVGFSGLSVHAQVALLGEDGFPAFRYLAGKMLTALITALMATLAVFQDFV